MAVTTGRQTFGKPERAGGYAKIQQNRDHVEGPVLAISLRDPLPLMGYGAQDATPSGQAPDIAVLIQYVAKVLALVPVGGIDAGTPSLAPGQDRRLGIL